MEFQKVLEGRRSVRDYELGEVKESDIFEMVKAAQFAPSWKNTETTRFYIALSKEKVEEVRGALADFNQARTKNAGAYIAITIEHGLSGYTSDGEPATKRGEGVECFDAGLATQNLLLKAYELGYGTLLMGLFNEEKVKESLGVNQSENVMIVIAVGKEKVHPNMIERKTTESVLHIL